MKRYNIFAGNYGSGKTEISLNTALMLAKQGKQTVLADMDIVNPYFRSAENEALLNQNGVTLIAPPFANTNIDVPSLSAKVFSAFEYEAAVFDAGGDPVGAAAMGGLFTRFQAVREETSFYYVINTMRPLQQTAEEIMEMLMQISAKVRLAVDGLIHNSNLGPQASVSDLVHGEPIVLEVSKKMDIPLVYTTGKAEIIKTFAPAAGEKFALDIFTRPAWMDV